jgi:quinolinate synthase
MKDHDTCPRASLTNRIGLQHLAWAVENLVEGREVNRIQMRKNAKPWARVALDRRLEVQGQ